MFENEFNIFITKNWSYCFYKTQIIAYAEFKSTSSIQKRTVCSTVELIGLMSYKNITIMENKVTMTDNIDNVKNNFRISMKQWDNIKRCFKTGRRIITIR